jgi:hypothetical protein
MSTRRTESNGLSSFDVIMRAVIGTIEVSPYGEGEPPHIAAFKLIADQDTPGVYEFPVLGTEIVKRITVEHIDEGEAVKR